MSARIYALNLSKRAGHRKIGGTKGPRGGEVLTPEPSGNRRVGAARSWAPSEPLNAGHSRAFEAPCAPDDVAMKMRFDRIGQVANRAIYLVISDYCRVLESSEPPVRGFVPDQVRFAVPAWAASSTGNLPKEQGFSISLRGRSGTARRQRAQESAARAWYVDCTSRPRGSAEGEGNQ